MTPERAKELLPIITAFANGETIQMKTAAGNWATHNDYGWLSLVEYRIKPKVPEYRLFCYDVGGIHVCTRNTGQSGEKVDNHYKQARVDAGGGHWLTDWLPIPNYPK